MPSPSARHADGGALLPHNDVVHLEWPVLGPLDTREVRLLDRHGKPLPVPLQLEEKDADGSPRLVTDVPLARSGAAIISSS
jgi:hypothetical protein